MRFYRVQSDYLKYLSDSEPRMAAQQLKMSRPYIGVVFSIHNQDFFAPVHSVKPKHEKILSNPKIIDCYRIGKENGKTFGVINLNNMIPVKPENLIPIDFNKDYSVAKANLFRNEYRIIKANSADIMKKATIVYHECRNYPNGNLAQRSYNFDMLIEKCKEYGRNNNITRDTQPAKAENPIEKYCNAVSQRATENVLIRENEMQK